MATQDLWSQFQSSMGRAKTQFSFYDAQQQAASTFAFVEQNTLPIVQRRGQDQIRQRRNLVISLGAMNSLPLK